MNEELRNELKALKSPLAEMEKHYFADDKDIPKDYFTGMDDRFIQFMKKNESPRETISISFFNTKRISYALAAVSAFAILSLGILTIIKSNSHNQLSESDVKTFLEEEGDFLAMEHTAQTVPTKKLEKLSDDEIKNYLCEVEGMDCGLIN